MAEAGAIEAVAKVGAVIRAALDVALLTVEARVAEAGAIVAVPVVAAVARAGLEGAVIARVVLVAHAGEVGIAVTVVGAVIGAGADSTICSLPARQALALAIKAVTMV